MVGVLVRGRMAWFLGMALGALLVVLGLTMGTPWPTITGVMLLALAGFLLILSYTVYPRSEEQHLPGH